MAGITITLGGNFAALNQLQTKVQETANRIKNAFMDRIGHRMFDGMIAGAANVARQVPQALKMAVDAASDLNETISKTRVIFGEAADAIMDWSQSSADALGLSRQQALAAAADFGGMFRVMGLGQDQVNDMSTRLVGLAADMASFNNTSVPEAILAIGSALRGEAEPIRRFNVLLNDATLKQAALAAGLSNGKDTLDPTTKALAAYNVILEQTADAQGDFAKTAEGLANSQRIVEAKFGDLAAEVGQHFLPVAERFANWLKTVDMSRVANGIAGLTEALGKLAGVIRTIDSYTPGGFLKNKALGAIVDGAMDAPPPAAESAPPTAGSEQERAAARVAAQARVVSEAEKEKAKREAEKLEREKQRQMKALQSALTGTLDKESKRMDAVAGHEAELALITAKLDGDMKRVQVLEREAAIQAKISELTGAGVGDAEARKRAEALADAEEELRIAERRREQEELIAQAQKLAGFSPEESSVEDLMTKLGDARGNLDGLSYRSTITADSMQRIGGGGGFAGTDATLDYQRQQTHLQREMVMTLRAVETAIRAEPLD